MVPIKSKEEIKILQEGGKRLASVLEELKAMAVPGVNTMEIELKARELIKKSGGKPAFLGYKPWNAKSAYPGAVCFAINDQVVHSPPSAEAVLKNGDIVGLDLGLEYKKLFTDMAVTVGVGDISPADQRLIRVTEKCLYEGIGALKDGVALGDYGFFVQSLAEENDFSVVKILVGHGVGYAVHEEPDVPNWGKRGVGLRLKEGMVLALEPMVCAGKPEVVLDKDGWTWRTKDGLNSAHFEYTIVVEKNSAKILTIL